jgi:hypothetical protein
MVRAGVILITGSTLAAGLTELYDSDRQTHKLVNQAILVLERNGPGEETAAAGHDRWVEDPEPEGTASRVERPQ